MVDRARSGRSSVQRQSEEDVLLKILPVLNDGLALKKVPELRMGCYMILTVLATKTELEERVLIGMMEAVVSGWTTETIDSGLTCLAILTQVRDATRLPRAVAKELFKIEDIIPRLQILQRRYKVDRLAVSLAMGATKRLERAATVNDLAFLDTILTSQLLSESQAAAVLASLISESLSLNLELDDGSAASMVADLLTRLSNNTALAGPLRVVSAQHGIAVGQLELKLQTLIRPALLVDETQRPDAEMADLTLDDTPSEPFATVLARLPVRLVDETSFLSRKPSAAFIQLSHVFVAAASTPTHVADFSNIPILRREFALQETLYFSFFVRIWSGPFPGPTRVAALKVVGDYLSSTTPSDTIDLQAILPYLLAALADPAESLRRAAADVLVAWNRYQQPSKSKTRIKKAARPWGFEDFHGQDSTSDLKWMSTDDVARLLRDVLLPGAEECILDGQRVGILLQSTLRASVANTAGPRIDPAPLKPSQRTALMSFLCSHALATPMYSVKLRLLTMLNRVGKVCGASRTKTLLPVLQKWMSLDSNDLDESCRQEGVQVEEVDRQVAGIVTSGDKDGLKVLDGFIRGDPEPVRPMLGRFLHERLRHLWPSLKADSQISFARTLMDVAFSADQETRQLRSDATDTLRSVELHSHVLVPLLEDVHALTDLSDEPTTPKRRRVNNHDKVSVTSYNIAETANIVRRLTLVLEIVDGSKPETHRNLLGPLFQTLEGLQRLKGRAGSDLAYLHGLLLGSLLQAIEGLRHGAEIALNQDAIRADLLVDCIRSTSSPQVQNSALLVIGSLAGISPELVLHSVMPIFTFMGPTVLSHDDEYSVHVISHAIEQVIPPLVDSLREQNQDPVTGTAELLLSFVAAFEHIPAHRRLELFASLARTLGEDEFLFALLAMLVDRYDQDPGVQAFSIELAAQFSANTQFGVSLL